MHLNRWHILLALFGIVLLFLLPHLNALAQEIPTPTPFSATPTPLTSRIVLPPGDTTILVAGAIILILIVFGAVIWTSKRTK